MSLRAILNRYPEVECRKLAKSRLLDKHYYFKTNPDVRNASYDPVVHFFRYGAREGRKPNPYFDPRWYAELYLTDRPLINPLLHYIEEGEAAGNRPICYFDPVWVSKNSKLKSKTGALAFYLDNFRSRNIAPNMLFDLQKYIRIYGHEMSRDTDPFIHFLERGDDETASDPKVFDPNRYKTTDMLSDALMPAERSPETSPMLAYLDREARERAGQPQPAPHVSEGLIRKCAGLIRNGSQESAKLVADLRDRPHFYRKTIVRIAIVLRDDRDVSPAERFLENFYDIPELDAMIAKELCYLKAIDGKIDDAIEQYDDLEFSDAILKYNECIADADCIGGIYRNAIRHEYKIGARRGVAWVINTMRKVLLLGEADPDWAAATPVCDLTIHYELLLSGALHRLLLGRTHVGLISCHQGLATALARRFDIGHVEFYKTPGEKKHEAELGADAVEGLHWPDRYRELTAILAAPQDRRGQLFLVAAGILGKIYAAQLKRSGAVVIDIGAVADLWMGKRTRTFPDLPDELKLEVTTSI